MGVGNSSGFRREGTETKPIEWSPSDKTATEEVGIDMVLIQSL
jgi:hypothetical protein